MSRSLKLFAIVTNIVMIGVLLGGALVTKTDSGLGCGRSFPLCHGQLIPSEITFELIVEFSHRLVSGLASIFVLILAIWTWRVIGHMRETKALGIISVGFIVIQAFIGASNVLWPHSDFALALHFGISLISFAAVFLLTLLIFEVDKKWDTQNLVIDKGMKFHIIGLTIYSYIVIYTGALVRHTEASLVCEGFPFCHKGDFSLPSNFYQWVQMGHRFAAFILSAWIFYCMIIAINHYKQQKVLYWGWIASFILISLQAISGAMVIFSSGNLFIALGHSFFITILFGIFSYFIMLITRNNMNRTLNASFDKNNHMDSQKIVVQ